MPVNMKIQIAQAAEKLLFQQNKKKLTVKDIVDECGITRQTFYYHFEDIPHLLEWVLETGLQQMKKEAREKDDIQEQMLYFFRMAVQIQPYIKKTLGTNYGRELELLLKKEIIAIAEDIVKEEHLYRELSHEELTTLIRYHSYAVFGVLMDWDENDTQNMDYLVETIYRIISGRINLIPERPLHETDSQP